MKDITYLVENLRIARGAVEAAKEQELQAQIAIYNTVKDELPESGSYKNGSLKITTGFYQKWNQESLAQARMAFPENEEFPFSLEYKPDNKALAYFKKHKPELFSVISSALTLTPKKPSFEIKD